MKHLLFIAIVFASCHVVADSEETGIVADTIISADSIPVDSVAVDTISVDTLAE